MWYTPNRQLTYNRIWNFVVGVRGGGKTFNCLIHGIEKFLKDGSQFIYLRRQAVQLDDACVGDNEGDLFAYIRHEGYFQDHELKVVSDKSGGYNFYCDGKIMGFGKALSTSTSRKSMALPKVKMIIFDEFMIDSTSAVERYLGHGDKEPFIFENFYETVTRGRDIPVFFIGNAFQWSILTSLTSISASSPATAKTCTRDSFGQLCCGKMKHLLKAVHTLSSTRRQKTRNFTVTLLGTPSTWTEPTS